jgi:hypothetical protein
MFDDEPVAKELVHLGQFEGIGQYATCLRTRRPP